LFVLATLSAIARTREFSFEFWKKEKGEVKEMISRIIWVLLTLATLLLAAGAPEAWPLG